MGGVRADDNSTSCTLSVIHQAADRPQEASRVGTRLTISIATSVILAVSPAGVWGWGRACRVVAL